MTKLWNAIKILRPNTGFGIGDEGDWDTIQMSDGSARPTDAEINSVWQQASQNSAMSVLREKRNQILSQTDWWVLPDRTATQAQLDYRQTLRDLPANSSPELDANGNLINVNWPEKP